MRSIRRRLQRSWGTSDPAFRGDPARWNPEQLQVAALSQCHVLWFLHLATVAGVVVTAYEDHAHGVMREDGTGAGRFESVTLRPHVTLTASSDPGALFGSTPTRPRSASLPAR